MIFFFLSFWTSNLPFTDLDLNFIFFYDFVIVFLQCVVLYRLDMTFYFIYLVVMLICVIGDLDDQNIFDYMKKQINA